MFGPRLAGTADLEGSVAAHSLSDSGLAFGNQHDQGVNNPEVDGRGKLHHAKTGGVAAGSAAAFADWKLEAPSIILTCHIK